MTLTTPTLWSNILTHPNYRLTNVIGRTFNPNLTYIDGTEYGNYQTVGASFDKKVDNCSFYATKKDVPELGFLIDLRTYTYTRQTVGENSGYVAFQVQKKNSNALSTNAYGHYAHLYNTINYSINVTSGAMSISGATGTDYMSDTGVSWYF
jgi:hypothetical protein